MLIYLSGSVISLFLAWDQTEIRSSNDSYLQQEAQLVQVSNDTLSRAQVRSLLGTNNGSVWIGTREKGIYLQRGAELFQLEGEEKSPGGAICMIEDDGGNTWFAGRSLWKLSGEMLTEYPENLTGNRVNFSIRQAIDGGMWVGGSAGALQINGDSVTKYGMEEGLKHPVVHDILHQDDGTTWFATRRGGLNKLEGSVWSYFLPEVNCRKLMITRSGVLAIGTSEGVLSFDPESGRETWLHRENIAILPEFEDDDGQIWCSSEGEGIWVWTGKTWEKQHSPDLKTDMIYSMIRVGEEIWAGTDAGVVRF